MRLVAVAASGRNVRQPQLLVRNETACPLKPKHSGGQFWRNTDHVSKTFTEIPPAITNFIRELLNRHGPMALRQSFPCPGDFGLLAQRVELRRKCPVQDGEALVPGIGAKKHLDELFGLVPPDIEEVHNERGYFLARNTQNSWNAQRFDKYVQPKCVTTLPHDRWRILQTANQCS